MAGFFNNQQLNSVGGGNNGFFSGVQVFGGGPVVTNPPWSQEVWQGSLTGVDANGLLIFTLGNASAISPTSISQNPSTEPRDINVSISVSPPATGFTGGAFTLEQTLRQPGRVGTSGPYTYGPTVVTAGGTFIISGSFTEWAPATAAATIERIDQERSRTQVERTTQTGTRTVTCNFDSCTGSSATVVDVNPIDVALPDDVEMRNIQNPLFTQDTFAFSDVAINVSAAVFINEDGFIRAINTSGTDVLAVGAQIPTTLLDSDGSPITAGITSAVFTGTATSGENNQLLIGISMEIPTNFANSGTNTSVSGRINEFYPEPVLEIPSLTVTVRAGLLTANFDDAVRGNEFSIGSATSYIITAVNSGSPTPITGLGTFNNPGVNGRFHIIEAEIANVGSDTVTFRVTNDGSS